MALHGNLYYSLFAMKRKEYTVHHLLPRSRSGSHHPRNKEMLPAKQHEAFHAVFANQTPVEQLISVLHLNRNVFTASTLQLLTDTILSLQEPEVYRDEIIARRMLDMRHDIQTKLYDLINDT